MKSDLCLQGKSQIAREILAYLTEYPDAQDTIDGIAHWWLLDRKIKYQKSLVREALAELVVQGFLLEWKDSDSRIRYRINDQKTEAIQKVLNHGRDNK